MKTLGRRCINVIQMVCVYCDVELISQTVFIMFSLDNSYITLLARFTFLL